MIWGSTHDFQFCSSFSFLFCILAACDLCIKCNHIHPFIHMPQANRSNVMNTGRMMILYRNTHAQADWILWISLALSVLAKRKSFTFRTSAYLGLNSFSFFFSAWYLLQEIIINLVLDVAHIHTQCVPIRMQHEPMWERASSKMILSACIGCKSERLFRSHYFVRLHQH